MLSKFWKIIGVNNTGQTITFNNGGRLSLKITIWFLDPSTGKMDYTTVSSDDFGFEAGGSLVDGGEILITEIDNTSNLMLGAQVQMELTHDEGTAAAGTWDLYLDSGKVSGELASDASGYDDAETNGLDFIGSLTWPSAGADDELVRRSEINI